MITPVKDSRVIGRALAVPLRNEALLELLENPTDTLATRDLPLLTSLAYVYPDSLGRFFCPVNVSFASEWLRWLPFGCWLGFSSAFLKSAKHFSAENARLLRFGLLFLLVTLLAPKNRQALQ